MATQPNQSVFSPEEIASFFQVSGPQSTTTDSPDPQSAPPAYLTKEEATALLTQNNYDIQRDMGQLRALLNQKPAAQESPKPLDNPRIAFDEKDQAFVPAEQITPIVERLVQERLDRYHQDQIVPFGPAVLELQEQKNIESTAKGLQKIAPDLMEGADARQMGALALEFYNSPLNHGADEAAKTQYVVDRLRSLRGSNGLNLPVSTGNSQGGVAPLPSYNNVGRTTGNSEHAAMPEGIDPEMRAVLSSPKGATIKLSARSLRDVGGLEGMYELAARQQFIYDYNEANKMGWKIEAE